jgi:Tfp pilus assembly protein PilO
MIKHWKIDAAGVALVLGLALGPYVGYIGPLRDGHAQAAEQAKQLVAERTRTRDLENSIYGLKEQLDATQRAAASSELKLEPAGELNARLARLTDLASENSLRVDSVESGATTGHDRYATVSIRITGQGNYRDCTTFLRQLRAAMPDVAVTSVQMGSAAVTVDTPATFAFDLLWHTQPVPAPVKK